jgi:hypothetical protein
MRRFSSARRRLRPRRAVSLAAVVALVLPAAASAQERDPVIPLGAKAAGQEVGGLTLTQAAALLDMRFAAAMRRRVEVRVAGHRLSAGPKKLRYAFDPLASARRANIAARAADDPATVDVTLVARWSGKRLRAFVKKADKRSRSFPRNAKLRITTTRMVLRKARSGRSLARGKLRKRIARHLQDPTASRILRAKRKVKRAKVNRAALRRQYETVVTIDRSSFRLRLFKRLRYVKYYGVAVGQPAYPTPGGRYSVTNKAVNPAWSAPDRPWAGAYRNEVVAGGSAENPLKARWLGIVGGVGIHGTAAEYSIGTRASHGCIRMRVADVIDLYDRVPVGATVLIR